MKKLVITLGGAALMLAACGGLEDDLKGHTYDTEVTVLGQTTTLEGLKFDGKYVTVGDSGEKEKYTVEDDEITFEENNEHVTFYDLEKDGDGNFKGKAKITEEGMTSAIKADIEMKQVD